MPGCGPANTSDGRKSDRETFNSRTGAGACRLGGGPAGGGANVGITNTEACGLSLSSDAAISSEVDAILQSAAIGELENERCRRISEAIPAATLGSHASFCLREREERHRATAAPNTRGALVREPRDARGLAARRAVEGGLRVHRRGVAGRQCLPRWPRRRQRPGPLGDRHLRERDGRRRRRRRRPELYGQ
eukprot:scaffold28926_cov63-Phaeocystis_antarctica.AAC.2